MKRSTVSSMKVATVLAILLACHSNYAQTNVLDWGSITLSGYSQTETIPTGQSATITYNSANNVSYQTGTNSSEFSWGTAIGGCSGVTNTGDPNASGIIIQDDYNSNYPNGNGSTAATDGKDWNISFSSPLTDVNFDIYDLSSLMHSASYPDPNIGVYNDKMSISGKDNNGNDIYPTLTNIGTTFLQGLDGVVGDCAITGGTYEGQGYAGDVDLVEFFVDNASLPPTAHVSAGTVNSSTGLDGDCFTGGFFYSMDINVDFGTQNVSEITITYHNYENSLLGSQDGSGNSCVQGYTGMAPQAVLFGDISYSVAVLPIELVSFEGKADGKDNYLSWTTASEIDNDYFAIMHSLDGNEYNKIGIIEGDSYSSRLKNYDYIHSNAPEGNNYYRLDQYDVDGTSSSSDVISISRTEKRTVSIFPTVSQGIYTIQGLTQKSAINVYALNGSLQKSIKISEDLLSLDISDLNSGMYLVEIVSPSGSQSVKLFKE